MESDTMTKCPGPLWILCTVEAGVEFLRALVRSEVPIAGVICLSTRINRANASGFVEVGPIARELKLRCVEVDDYKLSAEEDVRALLCEEIGLLVVAGWQRLIPSRLIRHARHGAIGLHGSPSGITSGRGRSPQNWAILCGARQFELSLFRIDEGVDSGPVLGRGVFEYTDHDDIASSYRKSVIVSALLVKQAINDWDVACRKAVPQDDSAAAYYPQRRPEDGVLDWNVPCEMVRRQVASVTRPYPGAFSRKGDFVLTVWRARPMGGGDIGAGAAPGQIVEVAQGALLVRASDGLILVDDFDVSPSPSSGLAPGDILPSVPLRATLQNLIGRHQAQNPLQPVSDDVLALVRSL